MNKKIEAIFLIVSTIVGLGVFLLPYALAQSGIFFWLWFIFLAPAIYLLHLIYGEIIFAIGERHNLPGLAARLLGPRWKLPVWLFDFVGIQLVLLALLIALAKFVPLGLPAIDPLTVKLATVVLTAAILGLRLNPFARIEAFLSLLLIGLFCLIGGQLILTISLGSIGLAFLQSFSFWGSPLLSYGLILFALTGYSSLLLVYDLLGPDVRAFRQVNLIALGLVVCLYLLYTVTVYGALGTGVSEESLTSLTKILPPTLAAAAVLLAVVNILTTLVALAAYLKRGFIDDFHWRPLSAWLGVVIPLCFGAFLPLNHLVGLASVIGGLFIGVNLMVLLLCHQRLERTDHFGVSRSVVWLLILVFGLGWLVGLLAR